MISAAPTNEEPLGRTDVAASFDASCAPEEYGKPSKVRWQNRSARRAWCPLLFNNSTDPKTTIRHSEIGAAN